MPSKPFIPPLPLHLLPRNQLDDEFWYTEEDQADRNTSMSSVQVRRSSSRKPRRLKTRKQDSAKKKEKVQEVEASRTVREPQEFITGRHSKHIADDLWSDSSSQDTASPDETFDRIEQAVFAHNPRIYSTHRNDSRRLRLAVHANRLKTTKSDPLVCNVWEIEDTDDGSDSILMPTFNYDFEEAAYSQPKHHVKKTEISTTAYQHFGDIASDRDDQWEGEQEEEVFPVQQRELMTFARSKQTLRKPRPTAARVLAASWDKQNRTLLAKQPSHEWYLDYAGICEIFNKYVLRSASILELGCGVSGLSEDIIFGGYKKVTAIDWSEVAIEECTKKREALSGLKYMKMDARRLHFQEASFDAIISKAMFDCMATQDPPGLLKALKQVRRVLKRGGIFFVVTCRSSCKSKISDSLVWWESPYEASSYLQRHFVLESKRKVGIPTGTIEDHDQPFRVLCYRRKESRKQRAARIASEADYELHRLLEYSFYNSERDHLHRQKIEQQRWSIELYHMRLVDLESDYLRRMDGYEAERAERIAKRNEWDRECQELQQMFLEDKIIRSLKNAKKDRIACVAYAVRWLLFNAFVVRDKAIEEKRRLKMLQARDECVHEIVNHLVDKSWRIIHFEHHLKMKSVQSGVDRIMEKLMNHIDISFSEKLRSKKDSEVCCKYSLEYLLKQVLKSIQGLDDAKQMPEYIWNVLLNRVVQQAGSTEVDSEILMKEVRQSMDSIISKVIQTNDTLTNLPETLEHELSKDCVVQNEVEQVLEDLLAKCCQVDMSGIHNNI